MRSYVTRTRYFENLVLEEIEESGNIDEKYVMQLVLILTGVPLLLHCMKHELKFRGNQVYQRGTSIVADLILGSLISYNVHIL